MMGFLTDPAFWASLGVILAAFGIEIPSVALQHLAELVAAIVGLAGVFFAWRDNSGE